MPLTDPELDLLMEALEDDPSGPFLQVGLELARRSRWEEAVQILWNGLAHEPDRRGWECLARCALESGRYDVARAALLEVDKDPKTNPEIARIEILVLERSGRLDAARSAASRFLAVEPNDVVVSSVLERLEAPAPSMSMRAADPFYTVERAERYVEVGRADRALRVFRRILLANPGDPSIELRIRQLLSAPSNIEDDLSAELTDPGLVPPEPEPEEPSLGTPGPTISKPTPSFTASRTRIPSPSVSSGQSPDDLPTDVPAPKREEQPAPRPAERPLARNIGSPMDPDDLPTQRMDISLALRGYIDPIDPDDEETEKAPAAGAKGAPSRTAGR